MITTTLHENLQTTSVLDGKKPLATAFNNPREDVNPGEMLAASLGACMLTMIGFMAGKHGDHAEGTAVEIHPQFDEKHSRITGFDLTFVFPSSFTSAQKEKYAKLAQGCPVHNSLREDMKYHITIK